VLISQGIEAIIEHQEDGWVLVVDQAQHARALETIRTYENENRGWGWHRKVFKPGLAFDWSSVAWVALIVAFYAFDARSDLQTVGVMDSAAVSHGQWWRLFTAVWLHADPPHVASNAAIGLLLLGLAMGRYGAGVGLLAAYLAGVTGNLMRWIFWPAPSLSLGASGMVMGALGLLASQSFRVWREAPRMRRYVLAGLAAGLMLFVLLGLSPGTDVLAHFGGFTTGLLFGLGLTRTLRRHESGGTNLLCGLIFTLLVIVPWFLAFRAR
jgi:membrane associated rhomboid family serine protease